MPEAEIKDYNVQFLFEHGYGWKVIEATSAKEALAKAKAMTEDPAQLDDIVDDLEHYDSMGDLQVISAEGQGEEMQEYEHPDFVASQRAGVMLQALKDIVACPKIEGPAGTTAYLISDERMAAAIAAIGNQ